MNKALIVGIDPGSTSAVAAIDLEGEMRLLESRREFPPSEIIQQIIGEGKPVIVACDTEKMPSTVEKIASSLGAKKFVPREDLGKQRKEELGEGDNSHEKDATASAVHAYRNLQREIRKIKQFSDEREEELSDVADTYFSENLTRLKQRSS